MAQLRLHEPHGPRIEAPEPVVGQRPLEARYALALHVRTHQRVRHAREQIRHPVQGGDALFLPDKPQGGIHEPPDLVLLGKTLQCVPRVFRSPGSALDDAEQHLEGSEPVFVPALFRIDN